MVVGDLAEGMNLDGWLWFGGCGNFVDIVGFVVQQCCVGGGGW